MIVELLDFRPAKATDPVLNVPEQSRVVLTPNGETIWADLCLMNQRMGGTLTDTDMMEIESRILVRYDTVTRLANELIPLDCSWQPRRPSVLIRIRI